MFGNGIINDKKRSRQNPQKGKEDGLSEDYLNNYTKVPFYYTRKRNKKDAGKTGGKTEVVDIEENKGGRYAKLMN